MSGSDPGARSLSGGRFAYVAHCLLNANSKVDEWATCAGVNPRLLAMLRRHGYVIRQLPCPELGFAGLNRYWQVKEQYDTPGYRRHCRSLVEPVVEAIIADLRRGEVLIVGVDGSPSMGVALTCSGPDWGGRPAQEDLDAETVAGAGVFIDALREVLAERKLSDVRLTAVAYDVPGSDEDRELQKLDESLTR